MSLHRRRVVGIVLALVPLLAVAGCSGSAKVSKVTGVVRYNGLPLPGGTLTFYGGADGKTMARTLIGVDGTYQLPNPPVGSVKIAVEGPSRPSEQDKGNKPPVVIPGKYANPDSSGLTYTVTEGDQSHDVELK